MSKSQIPQAGQQEVPRETAALGSDNLSRMHETLCTEFPRGPSRALQGQWAARLPMKTLCPKLLNDSAPPWMGDPRQQSALCS